MYKSTSLRVLEDFELDYVSGGTDEDADYVPYAPPPDGFSDDNLGTVTVYEDPATGQMLADFVYEAAYSYGGGGYGGDGGGGGGGPGYYYPEMVQSGQYGAENGEVTTTGGSGGRTVTVTRTVVTTKTGGTFSGKLNFGPLGSISFGRASVSSTTTRTITVTRVK